MLLFRTVMPMADSAAEFDEVDLRALAGPVDAAKDALRNVGARISIDAGGVAPKPATHPTYRIPAEVIRHAASINRVFSSRLRDPHSHRTRHRCPARQRPEIVRCAPFP